MAFQAVNFQILGGNMVVEATITSFSRVLPIDDPLRVFKTILVQERPERFAIVDLSDPEEPDSSRTNELLISNMQGRGLVEQRRIWWGAPEQWPDGADPQEESDPERSIKMAGAVPINGRPDFIRRLADNFAVAFDTLANEPSSDPSSDRDLLIQDLREIENATWTQPVFALEASPQRLTTITDLVAQYGASPAAFTALYLSDASAEMYYLVGGSMIVVSIAKRVARAVGPEVRELAASWVRAVPHGPAAGQENRSLRLPRGTSSDRREIGFETLDVPKTT